jgi:hypothetical protein
MKNGAQKKRPGGVNRALGNRPMGDWTASKLLRVDTVRENQRHYAIVF